LEVLIHDELVLLFRICSGPSWNEHEWVMVKTIHLMLSKQKKKKGWDATFNAMPQ
jgi:hypothetical protein